MVLIAKIYDGYLSLMRNISEHTTTVCDISAMIYHFRQSVVLLAE